MRIGIYDPYLDTLGGHERYCLDMASCLSQDHEVDIFWKDPTILPSAQKRFAINLKDVRVVKNIFHNTGLFAKLNATRGYDLIVFVSDGSIPILLSKKVYLSFQFPVPWVNGKNIITQLKLRFVTGILCNSPFVKEHIDESFAVSSDVLTPGVDLEKFKPGKKEKLILAVGRFTTGMNTKKQEVLMGAFRDLYDGGTRDWRLVLAGGVLAGDADFVSSLKRKIGHYPIQLRTNIPLSELRKLYSSASIYWHAAGYGEDLTVHPERAEHFGISTVEAMSAGAVPVVFACGQQKSMIGNGVNGFLWMTTYELVDRTRTIIESPTKRYSMSASAQKSASVYSRNRFAEQVHRLLNI